MTRMVLRTQRSLAELPPHTLKCAAQIGQVPRILVALSGVVLHGYPGLATCLTPEHFPFKMGDEVPYAIGLLRGEIEKGCADALGAVLFV